MSGGPDISSEYESSTTIRPAFSTANPHEGKIMFRPEFFAMKLGTPELEAIKSAARAADEKPSTWARGILVEAARAARRADRDSVESAED